MLMEASVRQKILSTFEQDTPGASPHFLDGFEKYLATFSPLIYSLCRTHLSNLFQQNLCERCFVCFCQSV